MKMRCMRTQSQLSSIHAVDAADIIKPSLAAAGDDYLLFAWNEAGHVLGSYLLVASQCYLTTLLGRHERRRCMPTSNPRREPLQNNAGKGSGPGQQARNDWPPANAVNVRLNT